MLHRGALQIRYDCILVSWPVSARVKLQMKNRPDYHADYRYGGYGHRPHGNRAKCLQRLVRLGCRAADSGLSFEAVRQIAQGRFPIWPLSGLSSVQIRWCPVRSSGQAG